MAQGTIEEGMLGVLSSQKSLFAGVLDGARRKSFSRQYGSLSSWRVGERRPRPSPHPQPTRGDTALPGTAAVRRDRRRAGAGSRGGRPGRPANPWSSLIQTGMHCCKTIRDRIPARGGGQGRVPPATPRVERDPQTGAGVLRVPVPPPEVLDQALKAVGVVGGTRALSTRRRFFSTFSPRPGTPGRGRG